MDDLFRIAIRAGAAYLVLLTLLRLAGKTTMQHGSPFDFVLALIIGDLVDDAIWGEVPMGQLVVAAVVLLLAKLGMSRASQL